jgi:hypothetical protein
VRPITVEYIEESNWPAFLEEQEKLHHERKVKAARKAAQR